MVSLKAQVSFHTVNQSLNINDGKVQRLSNAICLTGDGGSGKIRTALKNRVALISMISTVAINDNQFAGVFFDNIPEIKMVLPSGDTSPGIAGPNQLLLLMLQK